jgi:hypothetical protein
VIQTIVSTKIFDRSSPDRRIASPTPRSLPYAALRGLGQSDAGAGEHERDQQQRPGVPRHREQAVRADVQSGPGRSGGSPPPRAANDET